MGANGSVVFNIFGDGTQIYTSGLLTGSSNGVPVSLSLHGIRELALIVTDGGNGPAFDHADWADLRLTCGGSEGSQFAPPVSMPALVNTHGVTAADLNGDGRLDLVAANAGSNAASVWLGNGNGTFGTRVDFPTGPAPKSIAVGDVNRDNRLDFVSANQDGASVTVRLGNGSGGFGAAVNFPACTGTHEVAIGNFTADTNPDLLVACWGGSVVSFLRGNGNGTFAAMVNFTVGAAPHSIVARDFNGDGRLDAAVANHDDASISVLIGRGDGTFNPQVKYPVAQGRTRSGLETWMAMAVSISQLPTMARTRSAFCADRWAARSRHRCSTRRDPRRRASPSRTSTVTAFSICSRRTPPGTTLPAATLAATPSACS